ncbi:unnamed protein product [Boreogadus saida]
MSSDRVNPSSPALPSWDTCGGFHRPYSRGRALIPCLIKPIQRLNRTQVLLKRRSAALGGGDTGARTPGDSLWCLGPLTGAGDQFRRGVAPAITTEGHRV